MCSASPTLSKPFAEPSGGQHVLQVDVDAQQVADGVLVLDAVEAAQDDAALRRGGPPPPPARASESRPTGRGLLSRPAAASLSAASRPPGRASAPSCQRSRVAWSAKSAASRSSAGSPWAFRCRDTPGNAWRETAGLGLHMPGRPRSALPAPRRAESLTGGEWRWPSTGPVAYHEARSLGTWGNRRPEKPSTPARVERAESGGTT